MTRFWLFKSEPTTFSIDHLAKLPKQQDGWDGVRNYQARNFMKQMSLGEEGFFYHSACPKPAIVGRVVVVRTAYTDPTQFDPQSQYFDPKSKPDAPRWEMVAVKLTQRFEKPLTLEHIKAHGDKLEGLELLKKGSRLSVFEVSAINFKTLCQMADKL